MRWTNENRYQAGNKLGCGCAGFAFIIQDEVFGADTVRTVEYRLDWEKLRVGDHVRLCGKGTDGVHSVIVLSVQDGYITVVEGNYNSSIHWGRIYSADKLKENFVYRETCYKE